MSQDEMNSGFKLRIVKVDHYMTNPISGLDHVDSDFRACEINRVPVIRIFGTTEFGNINY